MNDPRSTDALAPSDQQQRASTALDYASTRAEPSTAGLPTALFVFSAFTLVGSSIGLVGLLSLLFVIWKLASFSASAVPVLSLVLVGWGLNIAAWVFLRDRSPRGWIRARNCLLISSTMVLGLSGYVWRSIHAAGDRDPMTFIVAIVVLAPLFAMPAATLIALTGCRGAGYFGVRKAAPLWFCIAWAAAGLWIMGAAMLLLWVELP